MSKYDTAINNTNTVGVGCGVWSVIYSWVQSVDWVAVGSFLGMTIAYLLNIYFNIQRRKDDKAKNKREIEILENKAAKEIKIIRENAERKAAIDALKLRIEKQEEIDRQAEENARLKAEQEKARIEAEKQAYAEEQARRAVEQERQRQAEEERKKQAEQARIAAEEERRAKDTEHRRWVNNQAKDTLMKECGLDEETAKKVIVAVSQGKIAHIFIKY